MKHIKKKYQFESLKLPIKEGATPSFVNRSDSETLKEINKDTVPLIQTTDGSNIWGMHYNYNGAQTIIPLPDLALVYFDFGHISNRIRKEYEKKLFEKLTAREQVTEEASNELYHYFGAASSCIIGMYNALEAFVNSIIPDDFVFQKELKQKTELYNKEQIQRNMGTMEKIKDLLPQIFKNKFNLSSSLITDLKNLRDEIVHTKSKPGFSTQEELIKKMLDFKYEKCMEDLRDFMNHYKPNYIENCECGKDF